MAPRSPARFRERDVVRWNGRIAIIGAPPKLYAGRYFYDLKLVQSGQVVLGAHESDIKLYTSNPAPKRESLVIA